MAKDRKPAEIERDARNIARLYLQGKVQAEIGFELKISQSTVSRTLRMLQAEWQRERVYDINEAKARELAKLDVLELEYWEAWKRSQGNAVTRIDSKTPQGVTETTRQEKQVGDPRFLDGIATCIKQRCNILGVEAPRKTEVTGRDGDPLPASQIVTVYIPDNKRNDAR